MGQGWEWHLSACIYLNLLELWLSGDKDGVSGDKRCLSGDNHGPSGDNQRPSGDKVLLTGDNLFYGVGE